MLEILSQFDLLSQDEIFISFIIKVAEKEIGLVQMSKYLKLYTTEKSNSMGYDN